VQLQFKIFQRPEEVYNIMSRGQVLNQSRSITR